MPLAAGTRLGPYEIGSPIGKGGMGEVYRARDTKLDREVAIKVLPEEFANDDERLARFEREAKLLASLNHPNIASIYGLEDSDGVKALVLELVEGPTLAERIAEGPIPVDEAIAIARQIAEALEAGHEAGVIHRDLKPANVKVKEDGTVKVLDYGLAKALEGDAQSGADKDLSQSPTLTRQGTQVGVILGTAAYMSPEQARGKPVDKRTDIWAFGVVLLEMLTGRAVFDGEDVSLTLSSVLQREPDWTALPNDVPPILAAFLRRCLVKDPKQRIRDIGDVRLAMDGAFESPDAPNAVPTPVNAWPRWSSLVATLLLGVIVGAAVWRATRPAQTPIPVVRSSIPIPPDISVVAGGRQSLALSADGTRLVYRADGRLYLRDLDSTETTPIRGAEGARGPFFSPDGEWIGFWGGDQLKKIAVRGGTSVNLCEIVNGLWGARWEADDTILFGQRSGIMRVSANGGTPEVLAPLPEMNEFGHSPQLLPGGKALLFTVGEGANWSESEIVVVSLESGERTVLFQHGREARYLPTGHIVFVHDETLFAARFDVDALEVRGGASPVVEGVMASPFSGAAHFSISDTGSLVYLPPDPSRSRTLVWVDRNGVEEPLPVEPRPYRFPRISPDGSRIALEITDEENDIWIWHVARENLTRLTFTPAGEGLPIWTPDGTRIAFISGRDAGENVYWKAADGTGIAERLTFGNINQMPQAFTPDGTQLVFRTGTPPNLAVLSLGGAPANLLESEFDDRNAELSPDGRWMAYESNFSGRAEIYVRPFPNVDDGLWLVSKDGGTKPVWAPDGREIIYVKPDSTLVAVEVTTEPTFSSGSGVALFGGYYTQQFNRSFDISPDGERFLMIKMIKESESTGLVLVQNWFEELARLVPTND